MSQSTLPQSSQGINHSLFRVFESIIGLTLLGMSTVANAQPSYSYTIVDTNQTECSDALTLMSLCADENDIGFGQDAQYQGNTPSYKVNGDGTVTDNNTGLIWAQTTDINGDGIINIDDKVNYDEGIAIATSLVLGGYSDWRVPSIKELYSLMLFDGQDPSGISGAGTYSIKPFIDHTVFGFESGDMRAGERLIDSQYLSANKYVATTLDGDETIFGVNFIDGRIKGYGATSPRGGDKTFYLLTVRGNADYGINKFVDNGDKTIVDKATGLIWQKGDSQQGMDWFASLQYCESLDLAGRSDWRLPNIKELHSILDYSRSPATSNSAAIAPVFEASTIINEAEEIDYANYWSSTTHANLKNTTNAAYVAFGRSLGYMRGQWLDVHGAGAQRSDPKQYTGKDYPEGYGPQGDAIRYENYVRCVTDSESEFVQQPSIVERETKQYRLDIAAASVDNHQTQDQSLRMQSQNQDGNVNNGRARDPMSDLDKNGDGKLSKDEARGPLQRDFDRIDSNDDGFITKDELLQRPQRK